MAKKRNMEIQVAACPPADKVLIRHLSEGVEGEDVALYFESHQCRCGSVEVIDVKMYEGNKSAVVQFHDSSGMCWFNVFLADVAYISDVYISEKCLSFSHIKYLIHEGYVFASLVSLFLCRLLRNLQLNLYTFFVNDLETRLLRNLKVIHIQIPNLFLLS